MADFKKQVEQILRDKGFLESEYQEVFEAMSEILHEAAEKTATNEPYATNTILNLREMSSDISDMEQFVERFGYEKTDS